ncbi:hypothetical protein RRG08_047079 [Elysia crispata]|uniref:Uncharacterized protein n=1 Tax=Elysia crispata TaxID=231223 RepID=A0AAE1DVT2_9GAST|nr:hypothetical protein RRG08_047079 [Elysia crispata]
MEALSGRGHQPWCCGQIFLVIIPGLTLDLQYGGQGGSVWAGTPALVLWSNLSGHHPRADLGLTIWRSRRLCLGGDTSPGAVVKSFWSSFQG